MKKVFAAILMLAMLSLSACQSKTTPESSVTLNGVEYKVIGADRVEARTQKKIRQVTNDQGAVSNIEATEQTIKLNGKHTIQISEDGSFTIDGVKQTAAVGTQPRTIRLTGEKITIE